MNRRRSIALIILAFYTGLFGLYRLPPFILSPTDWSLLFLVLYYLFYIFSRNKHNNSKIINHILLILIYILLVIITMPFRTGGAFVAAFKEGRFFFVLALTLLIYKDILKTRNLQFWQNTIKYLGILYSIIIFINVIMPQLAGKIFQAVTLYISEDMWGVGANRAVVKSNYGILFVHLSFVITFFGYIKRPKSNQLILIIIYLLAMFMQGWRAILFAVLLISLGYSMFFYNKKIILKRLVPLIIVTAFIAIPIDIVTNNLVRSKIFSTYQELSGEYSGTLLGRYVRAEKYQIPKFIQKPFWGYGFIEETAPERDKRGYYDKTYLLYNFDFGYLTLLIMFGIIGLLFFAMNFALILIFLHKKMRTTNTLVRQYSSACFVFILSLFAANYSFGGLVSPVGLLPLSVILGFSAGVIHLSEDKANDLTYVHTISA